MDPEGALTGEAQIAEAIRERQRQWVREGIQNAQEKAKVNKNLALFYKGQIKGLRAGHAEYKKARVV